MNFSDVQHFILSHQSDWMDFQDLSYDDITGISFPYCTESIDNLERGLIRFKDYVTYYSGRLIFYDPGISQTYDTEIITR